MSGPPATLDYRSYRRLLARAGPPWMGWFELGSRHEAELGFAVHAAFVEGRLVMVRNRRRLCWELPGGRREAGESILETARRELHEECGAHPRSLLPWCGYSVRLGERLTHGLFCLTLLDDLPGPPAGSEIAEARSVADLPGPLCYPQIQGRLLAELGRTVSRLPWFCQPPPLDEALLSILADSPPPRGAIPPPPQNPTP
ncbi:MAG: NUDIX domain-containing protein [bacterium]|nr:NUDIX domain-containing protein [bacterium]